jgi:hypothetical protein
MGSSDLIRSQISLHSSPVKWRGSLVSPHSWQLHRAAHRGVVRGPPESKVERRIPWQPVSLLKPRRRIFHSRRRKGVPTSEQRGFHVFTSQPVTRRPFEQVGTPEKCAQGRGH